MDKLAAATRPIHRLLALKFTASSLISRISPTEANCSYGFTLFTNGEDGKS